jgi:uncharacterized membrane protein YfcA
MLFGLPFGLGPQQIVLIIVGALAGGVVNGLTGFGTALTALGIWLFALSPAVAATLVIVSSVVSQLQTLPMIWRTILWKRVVVFVAPGIVGVPIGTWLLPHVDPRLFKIGVGAFLILYSGYVLARRAEIKTAWGGAVADGVIGFFGGICGGLAGVSGALPVVWTDIRGWTKEQRRAVMQMFNTAILSFALVTHALSGLVTREVMVAAAVALPVTIAGVHCGAYIYRRLADHSYQRLIMILLMISGVVLIWAGR